MLDVYIKIPFVQVRTALMVRRYESRTFHYSIFHIQLWKWTFSIDWFDHDSIEKWFNRFSRRKEAV